MSSVRISETASDGRNLLVYRIEGLAYIFIWFSEITQFEEEKRGVWMCAYVWREGELYKYH